MTKRARQIFSTFCFVLLLFISSTPAFAKRIAIIGTGNVGSALGQEFAALGHDITYGSRSPDREDVVALVKQTGVDAAAKQPANAAKDADIIVLAVPGLVVENITQSLGNLEGKIIIDPTNPLVGWDEGMVRLEGSSSNAEIIQRNAPNAFVVKAFSTLNVEQMIHPEKSGGPISILIAGNDAQAKSMVADLATELGLEPIDLGSIEAAQYIEGMSVLLLNNRIQGRTNFDFYLRKDD